MKQIVFLIVTILLLMVACKKESANKPPMVSISNPIENSSYDVLDTLVISASVSDDKSVERVEIRLVDEFLNVADHTMILEINQKEDEINVEYVIENVGLLTGTYYIQVKALDESDFDNAYVKINLNEVIKEWEGLLIIESSGLVSKLTPDGQRNDLWNMGFDYGQGAVNNVGNKLYLGIDVAGKFSVNDVNTGTVAWQSNVSGFAQAGYFHDIYYDPGSKIIFTTTTENELRRYSENGVELTTTSIASGSEPGDVFVMSDYIFLVIENESSDLGIVKVMQVTTGGELDQIDFNGHLVKMERLSDTEVLLQMNFEDEDESYMIRYKIPTESTTFVPIFSDEAKTMAVINNQTVIVSTTGGLYDYDIFNNILSPIDQNYNPELLCYDALHNLLFTAQNNTIRVYELDTWNIVNEFTTNSAVKSIFNLYNR